MGVQLGFMGVQLGGKVIGAGLRGCGCGAGLASCSGRLSPCLPMIKRRAAAAAVRPCVRPDPGAPPSSFPQLTRLDRSGGPVLPPLSACEMRARPALAMLAWSGDGSPVWGCTTTSGDQVPPPTLFPIIFTHLGAEVYSAGSRPAVPTVQLQPGPGMDSGLLAGPPPSGECARATRSATLQRGLPALPTRLGCSLRAVVRLRRDPRAVGYRPESRALVDREAVWLFGPSRAW